MRAVYANGVPLGLGAILESKDTEDVYYLLMATPTYKKENGKTGQVANKPGWSAPKNKKKAWWK